LKIANAMRKLQLFTNDVVSDIRQFECANLLTSHLASHGQAINL